MRRTAFRRHFAGTMLLLSFLVLLGPPLAAQKARSGPPKPLTLFGRQHLEDIQVVAEVTVGSIRNAGMGIEVVTLVPSQILLDHLSPAERRSKALLAFVNSGDLKKGTKLLAFLSLFGSGRWYRIRHRLLVLDESYNDKKRLIQAYIAVEGTKNRVRALADLKDLLLAGIADESSWIRWNTIRELAALVRQNGKLFGEKDLARIDAIHKAPLSSTFQKELARIRAAIETELEKRERQNKGTRKE